MTFYSIFKKTKEKVKTEKPIKILVDHREKNSLVCSELIRLGIDIEFQQLPVGDYLVDNVAIERKTVSDLKTSIINKRIMRQLAELSQHENKLLIIEGVDTEIYQGIIHENAFRGFLLSTVLKYQVPIIYTLNEADTATYIYLLAKKSTNPDFSLRASKIFLNDEQRLQFILEGFPQIGPVNAKKLLSKLKTLQGILNAPDEALKETIGKKADELIRLKNLEYKP